MNASNDIAQSPRQLLRQWYAQQFIDFCLHHWGQHSAGWGDADEGHGIIIACRISGGAFGCSDIGNILTVTSTGADAQVRPRKGGDILREPWATATHSDEKARQFGALTYISWTNDHQLSESLRDATHYLIRQSIALRDSDRARFLEAFGRTEP